MAETTNTGAIYGVSDLLYNGVKMGLISEDGMQPGGDSPTKNRIYSAQKRNAPFAVIMASPGSKMWSFTLIELLPKNLVQVMGGKEETDGSYTPPTEDKAVNGVVDIKTTTGHTIRIYNGNLIANFANGLNYSNVLGIACELEMQEVADGVPYRIYPPGATVPEWNA
jgi:hypothetical protein